MTLSAATRARIAAERQELIAEQTATRTYIVATRRKVNEKSRGEEIELPRDQADRLLAAGLVEEKPLPETKKAAEETTPVVADKPAPKKRV
ncbi:MULTISPECIES: hypothetical protein [Nocardia]|uniref:hypothetical protein n=1 Tax=Nocardia TaxID=1817 RepID=UPI0012E8762A|nr:MULTISPECIES: hypothetical protein [Nocardia]